LPASTSGEPPARLAPQLAPAPAASPVDPDLVRVVDAWPSLPEPIRRAVLALVESSR
jgi:hypothetical protein